MSSVVMWISVLFLSWVAFFRIGSARKGTLKVIIARSVCNTLWDDCLGKLGAVNSHITTLYHVCTAYGIAHSSCMMSIPQSEQA